MNIDVPTEQTQRRDSQRLRTHSNKYDGDFAETVNG